MDRVFRIVWDGGLDSTVSVVVGSMSQAQSFIGNLPGPATVWISEEEFEPRYPPDRSSLHSVITKTITRINIPAERIENAEKV